MKRIHILSTVNAANVSKDGGTYRIKNVCGAVDNVVMNRRLYPGKALAAAAKGLEGKPAPAGHPVRNGAYISAAHGAALASSWIGSYCVNARHESGRTLVDIEVNEKQARAHDKGAQLIERLDAAIAGTNTAPIHVSTGLNGKFVAANGESMGKQYDTIVEDIEYDHLAILLGEKGAATPDQGVGMFLNSAGEQEAVESATLELVADRRYEGLTGWVRRLLGNSELSFSQIDEQLRALIPDGGWVREVFPKYFIWVDGQEAYFKHDYNISSDNQISLTGMPEKVVREVKYKAIEAANSNPERKDAVKENILAVLNAAGISVTGLDDNQLLSAYAALQIKPVQAALNAAADKLTAIEKAEADKQKAELMALAGKLAVNSSLTAEDFAAMGIERVRQLSATAAPVKVGNAAATTTDRYNTLPE